MKYYLFTKMRVHFILSFFLAVINAVSYAQKEFSVLPYLQIGSNPNGHSLNLLWQSADSSAEWMAEYQSGKQWTKAESITIVPVRTVGTSPFFIYDVLFENLAQGSVFSYRVSKAGKIIFSADAKAPKNASQSFRFVASGDMGAGTKEAKQIAAAIYQSNPDLLAIAGDIVYEYGLVTEYKTKFWPVYNTATPDSTGMPLMHSIPFIAAVGNHDADSRDLDLRPDALAYYLMWDQPLNGPAGTEGGPFVPKLKGSDANISAFKNAAGDKYPRMANFSYNYGNSHWTVIDADTYVDWTDSTLKAWVASDLANAKDATWKFVLFHHPGFNSSIEHAEQQQMRLLAPVFEKYGVDIVFNGHVHNYQRSFPLSFQPDGKGVLMVGGKEGKTVRGRVVPGLWTLDKSFDGKKNTKPNGVIYIISGAGGQELYNPEQQDKPDSWQKFTDKFISTIHSFSQVDINGRRLILKQIDVNGNVVDECKINK